MKLECAVRRRFVVHEVKLFVNCAFLGQKVLSVVTSLVGRSASKRLCQERHILPIFVDVSEDRREVDHCADALTKATALARNYVSTFIQVIDIQFCNSPPPLPVV